MPKPTLQNRTNFKTYLRYFKNKFTSVLQQVPHFYIKDMLSSESSGISTTTNVNVVIYENKDTVAVTTAVNNNELIYVPALPGDEITLSIGSSSYTFNFGNEGEGIQYNGTTYDLGGSIPVGNKNLIVKGLGGGLLQPSDAPVYSLGISTTTTSEGGSVNFTVSTLNVGDGATLYYSTGGSMEAADFSNNSLTGSFNIVGVGSTAGIATVTRTIANDALTEGSESFTFVVRTDSTTGPVVLTSPTITVADVVPTYSVTPSVTSVNEGSIVTFTVTTTGVANGTVLYWTALQVSGTISASDFSDAALSGSFTVNNNTGTITRTIAADRSTESIDIFQLEIRRSSITGTIVATSDSVTINDTSKDVGSASNGLTFGPVQVNRDNGNAALASDWYTICGLENIPDGSSIALFIDGSGSMTQGTVQASYELLVSKLNARGITITTVTNPNEDWITPFLVDLP
jgi:hypothetical protein